MSWAAFDFDRDRWFLTYRGGRPLPPDVQRYGATWWLIPYIAADRSLVAMSQRVGPFSTRELAQAAAEAIFATGVEVFDEEEP